MASLYQKLRPLEKETFDHMNKVMDPESKTQSRVFLSEVNETYFGMTTGDIDCLDVASVVHAVKETPGCKFRQWIVETKGDFLNLTVTFWNETSEDREPVKYVAKSESLEFAEITDEDLSGLTQDEKKMCREMIRSFHFGEDYNSGEISTSIDHDDQEISLIFENVDKLTSSFVDTYVHHFPGVRIVIEIKKPSTVTVKISRKTGKNKKRRAENDSEDSRHSKRK